MKTGEGFMATAEYGESGLCGDLKAACDGDEGVMKNTEFQYSELNHNGVFCSACGMVWLKGV